MPPAEELLTLPPAPPPPPIDCRNRAWAVSPEVCTCRSARWLLVPSCTRPPAPPAPPLPEVATVAPSEKLLLEVLVPAVVPLTTEPP